MMALQTADISDRSSGGLNCKDNRPADKSQLPLWVGGPGDNDATGIERAEEGTEGFYVGMSRFRSSGGLSR